MRRNPEPESLWLSGANFSILLATPVASLVPNRRAFVFPMDLPAMQREGSALLATTHSPYQPCPGLRPGEEHSRVQIHDPTRPTDADECVTHGNCRDRPRQHKNNVMSVLLTSCFSAWL